MRSAFLTEKPARSISEPDCQWQCLCHTSIRIQLLRAEEKSWDIVRGTGFCDYDTLVHFSSGEDSSPAGTVHPQWYTWGSVNSCAVTRLWTSPTGTLTKCEYKSGTPDLYWPYLQIKQQKKHSWQQPNNRAHLSRGFSHHGKNAMTVLGPFLLIKWYSIVEETWENLILNGVYDNVPWCTIK